MKNRMVLLSAIFIAISCFAQKAKIEFTQTNQGILFTENGANVLFYQRAPKSFDGGYTRNNYVHPLWTLGGDTLTEDYPPDHAHHRGIFWTWHQTYAGQTRLGDAWECRDFAWDVTDAQVLDAENGAKTLAVTVLWKSPNFTDAGGAKIAVVRENTRITIYPKKENFRVIDFAINLLALVDSVRIGGSDDVKGYGGFSPRIKCPNDLAFISTTGAVTPQNEAVQAGPWLDMTGTFTGKEKSGFAILVYPANPAPIDRWILRAAKSMQNPVYPGREPVAVSTTTPTVLKYRVIVHNYLDLDLPALFQEYKQSGR